MVALELGHSSPKKGLGSKKFMEMDRKSKFHLANSMEIKLCSHPLAGENNKSQWKHQIFSYLESSVGAPRMGKK